MPAVRREKYVALVRLAPCCRVIYVNRLVLMENDVCLSLVAVDVWSVGCIMAELHGRKPLFPGEDCTRPIAVSFAAPVLSLTYSRLSFDGRRADIQQMNLMFSVLGTPSEEDMAFITNPKAIHYIRGLGRRAPVPWTKTYKNANPLGMH